MSPPVPKTAMVFAAGLGMRMRPITETLPKPLVKVGGRALIDHCLDRLAENGVERAIVNVHWLADQIEAHLAGRRSPKILISDERATLLDQGGGIKRALADDRRRSVPHLQHRRVLDRGAALEHRPPRQRLRSRGDGHPAPGRGERRRGRRRLAGRLHHEPRRTARRRASRAMSRPSSIPASASSSRSCSRASRRRSFASRRSFTPRRRRAASMASASTAFGCMSGGPRPSPRRRRRSTGRS